MKNGSLPISRIVSISLMTAILCIVSPFAVAVPISPVPISLSTFAIYLTIIILGGKDAVTSVALYVILGFIGLPVFTGFSGGAAKIMGPTGGYIIGYIFLTLVSTLVIDEKAKYFKMFLGLAFGTIVLYIFGTLWLAKESNMSFKAALLAGVLPFVVGDIIKIILSILIGVKVRERLLKSGIIKKWN